MTTNRRQYVINILMIMVTTIIIGMAMFMSSSHTVHALDYEKPLDLFLEEYYGKDRYQKFKEDKEESTYTTHIGKKEKLVEILN